MHGETADVMSELYFDTVLVACEKAGNKNVFFYSLHANL